MAKNKATKKKPIKRKAKKDTAVVKAQAVPEPVPVEFHNFAFENGEVLLLKRIPKNRTTHGGFVWPTGIGTVVECPDWNPAPVCGGGLHAWPYGFGLGDGCDYDIIGDVWMVLGAKPEDVVGNIDGGAKCKAKRVTIRMEGSFGDAMAKVQAGFDVCVKAMASSGNYSTAASSGDSSKAASSGNYSTAASSGYSSTAASSGYSSTAASSGDSSKAASSGDSSKAASSGYSSTAASSGNYSKAASSGNSSKAASSGYSSTAASSGDSCSCEASGCDTVAAIAGTGRIRVGRRGAFAISYYTDSEGWRFLTGKVGENGIKADTWYVVRDGVVCEEKT